MARTAASAATCSTPRRVRSTTRRLSAAAELGRRALPNVKVNLYQKTVDDNGVEHLKLVDTTTSTSWDDWAQGFRRNADGALITAEWPHSATCRT